ncbi:MAG TPA: hypothetical protein VN258_04515 [Mobilitalea sp.]|nr:hypothetical protein [Mobilitalea sp.]
MNNYVTEYLKFVNTLMAEYNVQADALKLDNRKDESNLYKVRVNICDIFVKMMNATDKKVASMKLVEEEEEAKAFSEEYLNWFEKIPESWKANLELARKHDDVIVVQTEEVKLETASLLRNKYIELASLEDHQFLLNLNAMTNAATGKEA